MAFFTLQAAFLVSSSPILPTEKHWHPSRPTDLNPAFSGDCSQLINRLVMKDDTSFASSFSARELLKLKKRKKEEKGRTKQK
jgi:hypothetical protein